MRSETTPAAGNCRFQHEPSLFSAFAGYCVVLCLCALLMTPHVVAATGEQPLVIWFDQEASDWEREGLPIGNGAMGAVVMGGVTRDVLQFNEKTLWTGGPGSVEGYDFGIPKKSRLRALAAVRQELNEKGAMSPEAVAAKLGNKVTGYGHYQNFGDVILDFSAHRSGAASFDTMPPATGVSDYRRELDLTRGVVTVSYRQAGVNYSREYFASYPDNVIVVHLTADKSGQINFTTRINSPENRKVKTLAKSNRITLSGALSDNGLLLEAQLQVLAEGGKISSSDTGIVSVSGADSATLILSAGTDYALDYPRYRGDKPHQRVQDNVDRASAKNYTDLLHNHLTDYRHLFARVALDVGQAPQKQPTHQLLAHYHDGNNVTDRTLEAVYFQFGRYLLISSSRDGSLPANLQGVWNNSATPPWNADYHVNINLQMNYWLADLTNLSETTAPLFDFVDALVEPGHKSAKKIVGANGWTVFLNTNVWGFAGVIEWPTAFWQPEAGAWLAQHYYEHYLFTGDKHFLRERAYPVMKGAAEFWLGSLAKDPRDGLLVASPSYSPEHGNFTVAAAMSQQIVFDLLRNVKEAAELLDDRKFADTVAETLAQLDTGLRIGSWGQLQEWKEDLDDPKNQHRHISHLFALHPGHQINTSNAPKFVNAARVSLNARGDGGTGWAQAWKINLWARLLDGNRAHKLLADQLQASTLPNLWDSHPPFQIDGNFGATAGMAEMLIQSQNGELHLLPALPQAWAEGSVKGLRGRGNVTVSMSWHSSELQTAEITTGNAGTIQLRASILKAGFKLVKKSNGKMVPVTGNGERRSFSAQAGETYLLIKT